MEACWALVWGSPVEGPPTASASHAEKERESEGEIHISMYTHIYIYTDASLAQAFPAALSALRGAESVESSSRGLSKRSSWKRGALRSGGGLSPVVRDISDQSWRGGDFSARQATPRRSAGVERAIGALLPPQKLCGEKVQFSGGKLGGQRSKK